MSRSNADNLTIWHCNPCLAGEPAAPDSAVDTESPQTPPVDWAAALAEMKRTIPLQQRIPKSVRGLVAETLAGKIEVALNQPSDQGWWDLFIFPYLT